MDQMKKLALAKNLEAKKHAEAQKNLSKGSAAKAKSSPLSCPAPQSIQISDIDFARQYGIARMAMEDQRCQPSADGSVCLLDAHCLEFKYSWESAEFSTTRMCLSAFRAGFPKSAQGKLGGSGRACWAIVRSEGVAKLLAGCLNVPDDDLLDLKDVLPKLATAHQKRFQDESMPNLFAWSGSMPDYVGTEVSGASGCVRLQLEGSVQVTMVDIASACAALSVDFNGLATTMGTPSDTNLKTMLDAGVQLQHATLCPGQVLTIAPSTLIIERVVGKVAAYAVRCLYNQKTFRRYPSGLGFASRGASNDSLR
jgi:hypothetical protein